MPGTSLVSINSVWPANGVVNADGTITFNDTNYPTPTAAAAAVKGTGAVNGWDFWAVDDRTGKVSLATLRARYLDSKMPAPVAVGPRSW